MSDFSVFTTNFPSIATNYAQPDVRIVYDQVLIETNGYPGICPDSARDLAIYLHTAHCVVSQLSPIATANGIPSTINNPYVKRVKNSKDEIEYYNPRDVDAYDFGSTSYGVRLLRLLESNTCDFGGIGVGFSIGWC